MISRNFFFQSCDYFDSILSPLDEDISNADSIQAPETGGLAWMQMDRTGLIKYFLKVSNLPEAIESIQIDNGRKSQRLLRIIHDLHFEGNSVLTKVFLAKNPLSKAFEVNVKPKTIYF